MLVPTDRTPLNVLKSVTNQTEERKSRDLALSVRPTDYLR